MPKYSLMQHQKEGVQFLDSVDGIGALLFDPGVGKTGTTLAWVDKRVAQSGEFRVLVVAPLTATDTWVLQAPPFMDSTVKARMLEGRTVDILTKLRKAGTWADVPDARVSVNHKGTRNKVTILSMSAGSISSFCRDDPKKEVIRKAGWDKLQQFTGLTQAVVETMDKALDSWCPQQDPAVAAEAMALREQATYFIGSGQGKRQRVVQVLQAVRKYKPHLVVVDESHLIKSAGANISTAMYQIGQLAPHRIILTGTVNPHSPLDCYGQWRFLAPWTFSDQYNEPFTKNPLRMTKAEAASVKPWPWGRFQKRYAEMGGYQGKVIQGVDPVMIHELHARVAERSMVVRKEDALDLPPVTDVDVHVTLSPREVKAYNEMRDELAAEMADGTLLEAPNALAKIMKLRQIASGFVKDTETGEVHVIGSSLQESVREIVDVTLAGENRVVVCAYFRAECAALADGLRQQGRTVEIITGETKAKERLAIRRRFADVDGNPEQVVLVAQARTMSLSVNELVTAQNAVFASMSERRDDWVQFRGRLDRKGQVGNHVTFWNVFVPGTVGEVMLETHKRRGDLEKALLDHIRMTPR